MLVTFSLIFFHLSSSISLVDFCVSCSAPNHSLHFINSSLTVFSILPSSKVSLISLKDVPTLATAKMKKLALKPLLFSSSFLLPQCFFLDKPIGCTAYFCGHKFIELVYASCHTIFQCI